ncbi:tetratricopeptide repeat protein [Dictyoglomus sp.]|uniref:tetratricopeptide repeat protein n=1 Tax=Dictyoglomus sp. TaxID=28205 RepID=UPI003D09EA85
MSTRQMKIGVYLIGLFVLLFLSGCASVEEAIKGEENFWSGQYDEAIEYFQKIDLNDKYVGGYSRFVMGVAFYKKGDYQNAIKYLTEVIENCEKINCATWGMLPAWYFWLGKAYYDTNNYKKAIENFSIAASIAEERPVPPFDTPSWKRWFSLVPPKNAILFWLGNAYYSNGEYQKAIESINKSIELDPKGSADVFSTLALAYGKMGEYEKAIASAKKAIEVEPQNTFGYSALGLIQKKIGQKSEAIKSFKKVIELTPERPEPYHLIARIYLDGENYEAAIDILRKSLQLNKDDFEALLLLSGAHLVTGNYHEVLDFSSRAIELNTIIDVGMGIKLSADKSYLEVESIINSGPADRAGIKAGDKIIKIDGRSTEGWDVNKVVSSLRGEEGSKVTLTIERKEWDKPRDVTLIREKIIYKQAAPAFAIRALAYRELGKKEVFLKDAEMAYSLNPNNSWAKSAIAVALIDKGDYGQALKILSTIKDSPFDRVLEAIAYAKSGDIKSSVSICQELPEDYFITRSKFRQSYIASLQNALKPYKDSKLQVAKELEKKEQYKEAIKEYQDYLKLADEKEAKEVRAYIAELMMKYPQYFALTEEARKMVIRAEVYTSEGKFEEAIKEYKKALKESPFFPALYKALALNFAQLKDYKQAIKNMNIYLDLYPDAPDARTAKDEIYRWEFLMEKGE